MYLKTQIQLLTSESPVYSVVFICIWM